MYSFLYNEAKQIHKTQKKTRLFPSITNRHKKTKGEASKKNWHEVPALGVICFLSNSVKGVFARLTPNPFGNLSLCMYLYHIFDFAYVTRCVPSYLVLPSITF